MKKTILHFIYSLARGGAETMLIRVIKELHEYNNIVVTLNDSNHFENELECDNYICLKQPSLLSLPVAAIKFRALINEYKPDIVHSHLPMANFVARLGTPKSIPLVTTIHTSIGSDIDYKKKYIRLLDKLTYKFRKSIIIGVSKVALHDYFSILKLKPYRSSVIYTFVDDSLYNKMSISTGRQTFLIISVGALRAGKNYQYLIDAFKKIKNENIELHIFGTGLLRESLQKAINEAGVKIILKGEVKNIHEILHRYNLFVMSSMLEGFSLSVLEAMAARLPLLLSSIQSFREQCEDSAVYFSLDNTDDFVIKLKEIISDKEKVSSMVQKAYVRMKNNFTFALHLSRIKAVYEEIMIKKTIVHVIDNLG